MASAKTIGGLWLVVALMLTISELGRAAEDPSRRCIELVGESNDSFSVTLQPGCDLRRAATLFPQIDESTTRPLPMHEQLRSIYAANEARLAKGELKARAVGRGCVPSGQAPSWASSDELEMCPRGLVNYFGVASTGNRVVIQIPKSRVATRTERLEKVARNSCGLLAGIDNARPLASSPVRMAVKEALSECHAAVPDATPVVVQPSQDPSVEVVKNLTQELEAKKQRIAQLEQTAQLATLSPSRGLSTDMYAAVLFGIAAIVVTAATYRRSRRAPAIPQDAMLVDKESLTRGMAEIEREIQRRLERERAKHQDEMDRIRQHAVQAEKALRDQIETLQRKQAELREQERSAGRKREEELEQEAKKLRDALTQAWQSRDAMLSDAESARRTAEKQLQSLQSEVTRKERRLVSLCHRLRAARERIKAACSSLSPPRLQRAGVGGLLEPPAE